ncbi:TIGR04283 family arsenosugar biosynthesis glycosyltransferase [Leptolyngbya sp. O-77]|uniref:TIGR04283 family arsenosugar biosynthesis glycosyltransferase n=1 Tax=Leptolyngbya sp. O-77 TaxID=1080068 RepID=UPI00074D4ADC|nr:TIGR04283 family arsenosugar biosynthesis glycosyltransferase [Leptolyngbya sp. O-77]BAU43917.1 PGL/p-HBAD biosynthesis glycosyltransferase/MT3031 [Leptolyngbya sp. O-77]
MILADHLILFSRYPQPGTTKTRLIPHLGETRAAQLQRQMTAQVLRQIRPLLYPTAENSTRPISAEIWFSGGEAAQMTDWLGSSWALYPQPSGDLGDRLLSAVERAIATGAERVVVIGADCPSVDSAILQQAFTALQTHDLVLGPATDGGYYLIGLRQPVADLFRGIDWGTERVFAQTIAIAQALHLSIATLDPLTDIDTAADLPVWEALREQVISVIIPTLNEAAELPSLLETLSPSGTLEVIVADGGSQDDTRAIAQQHGATVVHSAPGRARQMNAGAAAATGKTLLFLHADTRLPKDFSNLVQQTLSQPGVALGAFDLSIDGTLPGLRWVERGVRWRSRWFSLPYGDQALFLRTDTFWQLGGFPEVPILEDLKLVRKAQMLGKVAIAPAVVSTSARRWEALGVWQTTLINQGVLIAAGLGVPLERITRFYRRSRSKKLLPAPFKIRKKNRD